jgi:quercetin dioxygenase-like cupin family protein
MAVASGHPGGIAAGDVVENPALRLRSTVLEASPGLLRSETEVGAGGSGGPLHRHLRQQERFLVMEGTLRVRTGLRGSRLVGPGEELTVPMGKTHTFSAENAARFITEFCPAWQIAPFFQELFALASDGRVDKRGNPRLTDLALLMQKYPEDFFYAPVVPPAAQRAVGRLLVHRAG